MWETIWPYVEVLIPSVVVGLIFWFVIRSIFRADRAERTAEAEARRQRGHTGTSGAPGDTT